MTLSHYWEKSMHDILGHPFLDKNLKEMSFLFILGGVFFWGGVSLSSSEFLWVLNIKLHLLLFKPLQGHMYFSLCCSSVEPSLFSEASKMQIKAAHCWQCKHRSPNRIHLICLLLSQHQAAYRDVKNLKKNSKAHSRQCLQQKANVGRHIPCSERRVWISSQPAWCGG